MLLFSQLYHQGQKSAHDLNACTYQQTTDECHPT